MFQRLREGQVMLDNVSNAVQISTTGGAGGTIRPADRTGV